MADTKRVQSAVRTFLEKMKAMDAAIPEELAEDALEMAEEVKDACVTEVEDEDVDVLEITKDEEGKKDDDKKMEDALVKVLRKYGVIQDNSMKALDELEEEIKAKAKDKDDNTLDADGEEKVEKDPEAAKDSALATLRQMKRDVAKVSDAGLRKRLADNLAKTLRMQTSDQYASVFTAAQSAAAAGVKANDAKAKVVDADLDFGMAVAKKFNPHYKEG